jgi:hypothetical protein
MQVVIVEPKKKPTVQNIDDGFEAMQKIVGGTIQAIYPFEEPIALICNDEGKLLNLPLNRALRDSDGRVYDIVAHSYGTVDPETTWEIITDDIPTLKKYCESIIASQQ